jgi:hypothetical protein
MLYYTLGYYFGGFTPLQYTLHLKATLRLLFLNDSLYYHPCPLSTLDNHCPARGHRHPRCLPLFRKEPRCLRCHPRPRMSYPSCSYVCCCPRSRANSLDVPQPLRLRPAHSFLQTTSSRSTLHTTRRLAVAHMLTISTKSLAVGGKGSCKRVCYPINMLHSFSIL